MLLSWFCLIATSFFVESGTHQIFQEMSENMDKSHRAVQSRNKKDNNIAQQLDGENPHSISDEEIWFDTDDNDVKDYEFLDVEEDDIDDNPSYPSDERLMNFIEHVKANGMFGNYDKDEDSKEELLTSEEFSSDEADGMADNHLNQEKSIDLASNYDNDEDSVNELLTSEEFSSHEADGMADGTEGDDFNESDRFKREIDAEEFFNNLGNLTYVGKGLEFLQGIDFAEYRSKFLQPKTYTNVYDFVYATPETESRENRWYQTPCVSNLRELYTCIFCSNEPGIRQQFLNCFALLPRRVKEQTIKCYSSVLEMPFAEGSDQMDFFEYTCMKFKAVPAIIKCTESSLPELPKEKFLAEEKKLAKYSYCLHAINSQHCC